MSSEYSADEADVEEQETPVVDDREAEEPSARDDADEGDLLEQATPVEGDDDDYPNDLEVEPDV